MPPVLTAKFYVFLFEFIFTMKSWVAVVLASDLVAPWGVLAAGAGLAAVVAVFVGVALEVAFPVHEAGQALALARLRVALALSGHARTVHFARVAEIASAARTVAQQPFPAQQQVALCAV